VEVVVFVVLWLLILPVLLLPALARVRELSRRTKCGKNANQIVTAQNAWAVVLNQRAQPERFIQGTEVLARGEKEEPLAEASSRTDAGRAFVLMVKNKFVDDLTVFACPSDPFVAGLDGDPADLQRDDVDIPVEGKPAPAPWTRPGSPAAAATGRTFYSYSMQSGSSHVKAMLGPRLSPKLPVVGERNPYNEVFAELTRGEKVTAKSEEGNSWNHKREGGTMSFTDGRNFWLEAANAPEVPANAGGRSAERFDYVYNDADPTKRVVTPRRQRQVPQARRGRAGGEMGLVADRLSRPPRPAPRFSSEPSGVFPVGFRLSAAPGSA
jgi:hypothetical protein